MPLIQKTVYIREEDIPAWNKVPNKAQLIHDALQGVPYKVNVSTSKDTVDWNKETETMTITEPNTPPEELLLDEPTYEPLDEDQAKMDQDLANVQKVFPGAKRLPTKGKKK